MGSPKLQKDPYFHNKFGDGDPYIHGNMGMGVPIFTGSPNSYDTGPSVINIWGSRKYGDPPSLNSREFGDPFVNLGILCNRVRDALGVFISTVLLLSSKIIPVAHRFKKCSVMASIPTSTFEYILT